MLEIDLATGEAVSNDTETNDDDRADYIQVNGEDVPIISERFLEGEMYAFATSMAYALGPSVGESEYSSAVYAEDSPNFPNLAIGQSEETPNGSIETAISPGHFWYRTLAAKSAKTELKGVFYDKLESLGLKEKFDGKVTLLDYKMNFPVRDMTAFDYGGLSGDFVTIEESEDSWNNIQIPVEWDEKYGGLPPVVMEKQAEPEPEPESEPESSDTTLSIPEDFTKGLNKTESITKALDEFEALRTIEKDRAVQALMQIADASASHTYQIYSDYMGDVDETSAKIIHL